MFSYFETAKTKFDFSSIKKDINNNDVLVLHKIRDFYLLEELDKPSILISHSAGRQYTFAFKEFLEIVGPVHRWYLKNHISQIREDLKELFKKPTIVVSNSKFIQEQHKKYFNIDTRLIYPPIDRDKFKPTGEEKEDFFLSVQRIASNKKVETQVEAFKDLNEKLVIVGGGPYFEYVREVTEDINNIKCLGRVNEDKLISLYSRAKAVIQTGVKEDFGYVCPEAMACGTPAIAGDEGGFKEVINRKELGIRFNPENRVEGLKKAIKKFNPKDYDPKVLRKETEKYGYPIFKKKMEKAVKDAVLKHES